MKHLKRIFFVFVVSAVTMQACSSNEIGESKDVAQNKIYQQYEISYTEGDPTVKAFAQFRFAGRNGTTLVLDKPSQLSFDDEVIKVDSSRTTGAYYELGKPIAGFFNTHHFIFTDVNNNKLKNTFSFDAFKLVNVPAAISKKQAFRLAFLTTALGADDYITVSTSNTDSSFSITHTASDGGNFITIPAADLLRQKGNELYLQASLHRYIPLQQNTTEGGKLSIDYALKPVGIKLNN
jgi:hypothetical protein